MDRKSSKKTSHAIHFSVLIFLVCLLFTFLLWDRYLHSDWKLDRVWTSNLVLGMGTFFSFLAGWLVQSLEWRKRYLESQIEIDRLALEAKQKSLEEKDRELKVLTGLIPICANCKKIRNEVGEWEKLENYIHEHSEAKFSHSVCQTCTKQLYPELS